MFWKPIIDFPGCPSGINSRLLLDLNLQCTSLPCGRIYRSYLSTNLGIWKPTNLQTWKFNPPQRDGDGGDDECKWTCAPCTCCSWCCWWSNTKSHKSQKYKQTKNIKFTKSPRSAGSMHRFKFFAHVVLITFNKISSVDGMSRDMRTSSIRKCIVGEIGEEMGAENCHILSYRAFPNLRIWYGGSDYVTKGLTYQKGAQK